MTRRAIPDIIMRMLDERGSISNREVVAKSGVSRQAVHRYLKSLVDSGVLVIEGAGRSVRYRRRSDAERFRYRRFGLEEDRVWDELSDKVSRLSGLSGNAENTFRYAFTEILNNAIEHSRSEEVEVLFEKSDERLAFETIDWGIGIFDHLVDELGLAGKFQAIQELSKGKVTTKPEHHTGEGIFFVSKIADIFEIDSGGISWVVDNIREDTGVCSVPDRRGTRVRFELDPASEKLLEDLFARYTDDYEFSKTRTTVKLFSHGVRFVSRSEARRLMSGLERFREIILDFRGVEGIGQGFVDEVFRVWSRAHPDIRITPVNMAPPVDLMIRRGGLR